MITSVKLSEADKIYFGMTVGDQDKPLASHFTSELCKRTLEGKMESIQDSVFLRHLMHKLGTKGTILHIQLTMFRNLFRKVEAGFFVGLQIKKIMACKEFTEKVIRIEKSF